MKAVCTLLALLSMAALALAQTPPHSTTLNWTNSVSSCVVNTNVHRVQTKGTEAQGTNFAVVPVASGSSFVDTTVVGGQTYFYTVSAYGPTCGGTTHESLMSTELTIVVPPDCLAPSTLVNGVCTAPPAAPSNLTGNVQ